MLALVLLICASQSSRLFDSSDSEDFGIRTLYDLIDNLEDEVGDFNTEDQDGETWDEDIEETFYLNPAGIMPEKAVGKKEVGSSSEFELGDELTNLLADLHNFGVRRNLFKVELMHHPDQDFHDDHHHEDEQGYHTEDDYHHEDDHHDTNEDDYHHEDDHSGHGNHNLGLDTHLDFGHNDFLHKKDKLGVDTHLDTHLDLDKYAHLGKDQDHTHLNLGHLNLGHGIESKHKDSHSHHDDFHVAHEHPDDFHGAHEHPDDFHVAHEHPDDFHVAHEHHDDFHGAHEHHDDFHGAHESDHDFADHENNNIESDKPDLGRYNDIKEKVRAKLRKLATEGQDPSHPNVGGSYPPEGMEQAQKQAAVIKQLQANMQAKAQQAQDPSYSQLFQQYNDDKLGREKDLEKKSQLARDIAKHIVEKLIELKENGHANRLEMICEKYPFVDKFMHSQPDFAMMPPNQGPLILDVRQRLQKMGPQRYIPGAPLPPGVMGVQDQQNGIMGGQDQQNDSSDSSEDSGDNDINESNPNGGQNGNQDSSKQDSANDDQNDDAQDQAEQDNMPPQMVNRMRESLKQAMGPAAHDSEMPGSPGPHGNSNEVIPGMYIHPGLGPLRITHPETVTCEAATCGCGFTQIRWAYRQGCYNVEGDCAKCEDDQSKKLQAIGFSYKFNPVVKKTLPLFTYRETDRTWHNEPKFKSTCPKGKVLTGVGTIVTKYDDKMKHSMRVKCAVGSEE